MRFGDWFIVAVFVGVVGAAVLSTHLNRQGAERAVLAAGYSAPTLKVDLRVFCAGGSKGGRIGYRFTAWRGEVFVKGRLCYGGFISPAIKEEGR